MIKNYELKLKVSYISGLRDVVFTELKEKTNFDIEKEDGDSFYLNYVDNFEEIINLKSISNAYLVVEDAKFNPLYISNHKSILGDLINKVIIKSNKNSFKTFNIDCAGFDSEEVLSIKEYITNEFNLENKDDVDLKIYIAKIKDVWEVGVRITPKPLSVRDYKIKNMSGAMNPTIAYALNSLCDLGDYKSYLNVFSGSATLMIEAGLEYSNLNKILGFDNNKESLSLSIQNIKKSGLIKKIQIKEHDIYKKPDLGKFDVIVSDLPFGMAISKGEDLQSLYRIFIKYCENSLNENGRVGVYTSKFDLFKEELLNSNFRIDKEVNIKLITNENIYLPVKILILSL